MVKSLALNIPRHMTSVKSQEALLSIYTMCFSLRHSDRAYGGHGISARPVLAQPVQHKRALGRTLERKYERELAEYGPEMAEQRHRERMARGRR